MIDWVAGSAQQQAAHTLIGPNLLYFRQQGIEALNFDGSVAWRFDPTPYTRQSWAYSVADDGTVYVTTGNGDGTAALLLAVNPNTPGAVRYIDGRHHIGRSNLIRPGVDDA